MSNSSSRSRQLESKIGVRKHNIGIVIRACRGVAGGRKPRTLDAPSLSVLHSLLPSLLPSFLPSLTSTRFISRGFPPISDFSPRHVSSQRFKMPHSQVKLQPSLTGKDT